MKKLFAILALLAMAPGIAGAGQVGSAYQVYRMGSSGTIPAFGSIDLSQSAAKTGTLPHGNGGTDVTASGTAGNALISDGSSWTSAPNTKSYDIKNCALTATVAASALTISLKQADGSSAPSSSGPCVISFRNATAATGDYTVVSATAATTLVVSSGSTLGLTSAVAGTIYVYALNNAGTIELATSRTYYDEGTVQTTVAEGGAGAADSAISIYSTTQRTSKAIRLIGRLTATEATAGTWATAPAEISLWPFLAPPMQSWSGYHDTTCSWARSNAAYGDPATDATCALVERTNKYFPAVSNANGGSALPGITWTSNRSGNYWACAAGKLQVSSTIGTMASVRLIDGPGNIIGETTVSPPAATAQMQFSLCGILNIPASGATTVINIQSRQDSGGSVTISSSLNTSAIEWTIFQLN